MLLYTISKRYESFAFNKQSEIFLCLYPELFVYCVQNKRTNQNFKKYFRNLFFICGHSTLSLSLKKKSLTLCLRL